MPVEALVTNPRNGVRPVNPISPKPQQLRGKKEGLSALKTPKVYLNPNSVVGQFQKEALATVTLQCELSETLFP